MVSGNRWRVVGGEGKGGILVRTGAEFDSEKCPQRLATGSLLLERAIEDERLCYQLVAGNGPVTGWVSIKLKDKQLVVKVDGNEEPTKATKVDQDDEVVVVKTPEPATAPQAQTPQAIAPDTPTKQEPSAAQQPSPGQKGLFVQRIGDNKKVKIVGLKSEAAQQYNGKNGAVRAFHADTGRYDVKVVVLSELGGSGEKAGVATVLSLKYENLELHQDQVERDAVLNGDEIVLLGAGDAKRKLYEVKLDPQYWYDKAIERVLDAKNDFEVLDLPVEMIDDMRRLKQQYRRISLAVHPDKNSHPQATDAFRKVYGAFETLMDMKQQRRMLWILGKLSKEQEEACTFDDEEEDELFQWWWEATVPQIEKQVAEFEGQRLDEFGAMWISADGLGGNVEDVKWVGLETAKRLHSDGKAIFIDVRDRPDFAMGHIADAYCAPLPEIIDYGLVNIFMAADENLIGLMLKNRHWPIIIYSEVATPFSRCRAFCRWLLRAGHSTIKAARLRRLRGGMFGWKHKDGPVARPLMDQSYELTTGSMAQDEDGNVLGGHGWGISARLLGNDVKSVVVD